MRVLVCGGRKYGKLPPQHLRQGPEWEARLKEYEHVMATLERFAVENSACYKPDDNWLPFDIEIVSGCATGADSVAIDWAVVNWCHWLEFPAEWDKHGKKAGFIRNQKMLDEGKPDVVIAFPGGNGTKDMIRRAEAAGVKVIIAD
jgi:hypothetical protein